jgi:hypothetical protein
MTIGPQLAVPNQLIKKSLLSFLSVLLLYTFLLQGQIICPLMESMPLRFSLDQSKLRESYFIHTAILPFSFKQQVHLHVFLLN